MKKYSSQLVFAGLLIALILVFYFSAEVLLPFVIGLILAYALNPTVVKIRRFIPNRNVAVTVFLLFSTIVFLSVIALFGTQLVRDTQRLGGAFSTFLETNSEQIDEGAQEVKDFIGQWYTNAELEKQLNEFNTDSLQLDTETLSESFSTLTSFFNSDDTEEAPSRDLNWTLILLYSLGYLVYILYTYGYFETRLSKYMSGPSQASPFIRSLIDDLKQTVLQYFGERSKVVVICASAFIITFLIMGMPGAIILGLFAGLLCYIAHFHYLALIPLSLTCWALSVEQGHSFFLYFGIVLAVFIVISIVEEMVFFPYIMKGVASMNPAIMLVSLSFWSFVLGTIGLFVGLPLTLVFMRSIDHFLLNRPDESKNIEAP